MTIQSMNKHLFFIFIAIKKCLTNSGLGNRVPSNLYPGALSAFLIYCETPIP